MLMKLQYCTECNIQVASKTCIQCHDSFCDVCFRGIHSRGTFSHHKTDAILLLCEICKERTARYRCKTKNEVVLRVHDSAALCFVCYETEQNRANALTKALGYSNARARAIGEHVPLFLPHLLNSFMTLPYIEY